MNRRKYLLILISTCILLSCQPDPLSILDTPENYEFYRGNQSTVDFSGQTIRLQMAEELVTLMATLDGDLSLALERFRNESEEGNEVAPFANEELNNSAKNIHSKVAASIDLFSSNTVESSEIKSTLESFITNQYEEVIPLSNSLAIRGTAGQIADGTTARYVNSKGMENDHLLAKSLIGALILDQIINNYLSSSILDEASNKQDNDVNQTVIEQAYTTMEHKWDEAYGYLFGLSINPEDPLPTLGEGMFLNKYLKRVNDDNDFTGIATDVFNAFRIGRAAIVAKEYDIRDEQAAILKSNLSKVIGIRAVYYLQQAKNLLESQNYGAAFHALSEGYGFIYSLRFTRDAYSSTPLFSKVEVQSYLNILENTEGFWNVSNEDLETLSTTIAAKFEFTVAQASE